MARGLRGSTTPIVLVANKAEGRAGEAGVYEAMAIGMGDPVQLSAEHGEGMGDLFEALLPHIDGKAIDAEDDDTANPDATTKLAIVGRPQAGKSPLINSMPAQERMNTGLETAPTRDCI